jgi:hypothetical protein
VVAPFALALALGSPAAADTYAPNRLGDHAPNGCNAADCTLREAVIRANSHAGADTVVLQGGKTYSLLIPGLSEDHAQMGDLDLNSAMTIRSSNATKLATVKQAPDTDRVFDTCVLGPAKVRFEGLRITGGNGGAESAFSRGGGILNSGCTLTLLRSNVVGNRADEGNPGLGAGGGGIASKSLIGPATVRIIRSTVADNDAVQGGGVLSESGLVVDRSTIADNRAKLGAGVTQRGNTSNSISNSTISANRASDPGNTILNGGSGGGVFVTGPMGAQLALRNDTIAANRATGYGGGIFQISNYTTTRLVNVTLARNRADSDNSGGGEGGGISRVNPGKPAIGNSLLVNNRGTDGEIRDCDFDDFHSLGHNILTSGLDICDGFNASGDLRHVASPGIGPLGSNGGPTQTIPLLAGSPAIGHSGQNAPFRDQRGVKRDTHPDTGAFERR